MSFLKSEFAGDAEFCITCTGDCVAGDVVRFERATFSGSFRSPKFIGFELVTGEIVSDGYGAQKQQHTFTILLPNGEKLMIKGRNLYKNGTFRKPWSDEDQRTKTADEKHHRGTVAREMREIRKALGV